MQAYDYDAAMEGEGHREEITLWTVLQAVAMLFIVWCACVASGERW
jgi:small-conductance mechanosensitive channel